jgi:hypothetical protein
LEGDLEELLGGSFPEPGNADRLRQIFSAALLDDGLFGYPMSVIAG